MSSFPNDLAAAEFQVLVPTIQRDDPSVDCHIYAQGLAAPRTCSPA
jgi:hypothetical protein